MPGRVRVCEFLGKVSPPQAARRTYAHAHKATAAAPHRSHWRTTMDSPPVVPEETHPSTAFTSWAPGASTKSAESSLNIRSRISLILNAGSAGKRHRHIIQDDGRIRIVCCRDRNLFRSVRSLGAAILDSSRIARMRERLWTHPYINNSSISPIAPISVQYRILW